MQEDVEVWKDFGSFRSQTLKHELHHSTDTKKVLLNHHDLTT